MNGGMFAGGLLLSCTLIAFALWLQWTERQGWPGEEYDEQRARDQLYLQRRRRSRRLVNGLIGLCGVLIGIATFAGIGRTFVAAWLCVMVVLFGVVMLALLDAFRTVRYEKDKRRDIRRESIGNDD
ncbi:hypothetical protein Pla52nx_006397 [Stieleria varia]|uniref:Uncharacterized protein n=2 Tax=Stieleria varia TaxID=2528005 RepID=A0A5C5ZWQ6_9BACT|nr:hypothetical protein Pla52n_65570 [Stieleria varia]